MRMGSEGNSIKKGGGGAAGSSENLSDKKMEVSRGSEGEGSIQSE